MPSAYIETTIPSYYVARTSLNLLQASRQVNTRLWWDSGCSGFDLFTSLEAIDEAQEGDSEMATARLALLRKAARLDITNEVGFLAQKLVASGLANSRQSCLGRHSHCSGVRPQNGLSCYMEFQAHRKPVQTGSLAQGGSRKWIPLACAVQS